MRLMTQRQLGVAGAVVCLTLTACGTTVPQDGGTGFQAGTGADGLGGSSVAAGGAPGALTPTGGTAGGSPATRQGPASPELRPAGSPASQPGTATGSAAGSTAGGASGAGIPAGDTLVVGFVTQKDLAAAGSAVGLTGIATGDTENQMRAITADINSRGGVLGRQIRLVSHDVKTSEATTNPDQSAFGTCEALAEKKARFVVNTGQNPSLLSCLAKHGIVLVDSTGIRSSAASFAEHGSLLFSPSAMSIDRYLPAVVDRLVAQQYFRAWDARVGDPGSAPVKIGVQAFDNEQGRHYVAVLDQALRRHGFRVDERDLHGTDVAQNSSATSAAVLRFAARGVTHVFNANVLFYKDAESQGYYPRYAVDDTIATPALLAQNVGRPGVKGPLHGAMGAGYLPAYEVPNPTDVSPAATRCKQLMSKAGEDLSQSLTLVLVLHICDAMTFLDASLEAGGELSGAGMQRGLSSLNGYQSTITYQGAPTAAHHDGARRIRDFGYDDECGCFVFPSATTYPVA